MCFVYSIFFSAFKRSFWCGWGVSCRNSSFLSLCKKVWGRQWAWPHPPKQATTHVEVSPSLLNHRHKQLSNPLLVPLCIPLSTRECCTDTPFLSSWSSWISFASYAMGSFVLCQPRSEVITIGCCSSLLITYPFLSRLLHRSHEVDERFRFS